MHQSVVNCQICHLFEGGGAEEFHLKMVASKIITAFPPPPVAIEKKNKIKDCFSLNVHGLN